MVWKSLALLPKAKHGVIPHDPTILLLGKIKNMSTLKRVHESSRQHEGMISFI